MTQARLAACRPRCSRLKVKAGCIPGSSATQAQERRVLPPLPIGTRHNTTFYSSQNFNVLVIFDKQEWPLSAESTSLLIEFCGFLGK